MAVFGCKKQWHKPRPNFIAKSWSMPQKPVRKYGSAAWWILWGQCLFFKSLQRAEGGGVAEPAWLRESQLRMATILGLVNTGEAIFYWEDGPRGTKMHPSVWGHMPRMQGSLSESVFVHHPVTFLEVILPCCPNCTWTMTYDGKSETSHICNLYHLWDLWRKIIHLEKFQISIHERWGETHNFSTCRGASDFST